MGNWAVVGKLGNDTLLCGGPTPLGMFMGPLGIMEWFMGPFGPIGGIFMGGPFGPPGPMGGPGGPLGPFGPIDGSSCPGIWPGRIMPIFMGMLPGLMPVLMPCLTG